MPTISEPVWKDTEERRALCVQDYLDAVPGTVSASADVLAARLFALGLRGQDLRTEVRMAEMNRLRKRPRRASHEERRMEQSLSVMTQILKRKDN